MEKFILDEPMTLAEINSKRKSVKVKGVLLALITTIAATCATSIATFTEVLAIYLACVAIVGLLFLMSAVLYPKFLKTERKHKLLEPDGEELATFMEMANKQGFDELKVYASKIAKLGRLPSQAEYEAFEKWISEAKMRAAVNECRGNGFFHGNGKQTRV